MSKFRKVLALKDTKMREPIYRSLRNIVKPTETIEEDSYFTIYRLEAVIGTEVKVPSSEKADVLQFVREKAETHLVNLMFEEFRMPLIEIAHETANLGELELSRKVSRILDQMFKE